MSELIFNSLLLLLFFCIVYCNATLSVLCLTTLIYHKLHSRKGNAVCHCLINNNGFCLYTISCCAVDLMLLYPSVVYIQRVHPMLV